MKKFMLIVLLSPLLAGCGEVGAPVATRTPTIANGLCNPSCSTDTSPVPTQAPIPTPTADVSGVKQNIANAIQADTYTVTYCFILDKLPAITIVGQEIDLTMDDSQVSDRIDVERAKECIFGLEKDAWSTSSSFTLVTAHVQVLLQDRYGKQFVGDLAYAWLERVTEQKFVWSNLDADSAWGVYNKTYLLPSS